jgi:hypothetical protein
MDGTKQDLILINHPKRVEQFLEEILKPNLEKPETEWLIVIDESDKITQSAVFEKLKQAMEGMANDVAKRVRVIYVSATPATAGSVFTPFTHVLRIPCYIPDGYRYMREMIWNFIPSVDRHGTEAGEEMIVADISNMLKSDNVQNTIQQQVNSGSGCLMFVPGDALCSSHDGIRKELQNHGINVVVVNSDHGKPGQFALYKATAGDQHDLSSDQDSTVCSKLQVFWSYCLDARQPMAIVGRRCVDRSVTVHGPNMTITLALFSSWLEFTGQRGKTSMVKDCDIIQLLCRIAGSFGGTMTTIFYSSPTLKDIVLSHEQVMIDEINTVMNLHHLGKNVPITVQQMASTFQHTTTVRCKSLYTKLLCMHETLNEEIRAHLVTTLRRVPMETLGLNADDFKCTNNRPPALSHHISTNQLSLFAGQVNWCINQHDDASLFRDPHKLRYNHYSTLWFPLQDSVFIISKDYPQPEIRELCNPDGVYFYHKVLMRGTEVVDVTIAHANVGQ